MAVAPEYLEISCESCGAKVIVEPLQRTSRCPYCDSPSVARILAVVFGGALVLAVIATLIAVL